MASGSSDHQKTREQIEEELFVRLEFARTQYEKLMSAAAASHALAEAALGSDYDMALRYAHAQIVASKRALALYLKALNDFTDFAIDGKMAERPATE